MRRRAAVGRAPARSYRARQNGLRHSRSAASRLTPISWRRRSSRSLSAFLSRARAIQATSSAWYSSSGERMFPRGAAASAAYPREGRPTIARFLHAIRGSRHWKTGQPWSALTDSPGGRREPGLMRVTDTFAASTPNSQGKFDMDVSSFLSRYDIHVSVNHAEPGPAASAFPWPRRPAKATTRSSRPSGTGRRPASSAHRLPVRARVAWFRSSGGSRPEH
jgi:hypothetical protein